MEIYYFDELASTSQTTAAAAKNGASHLYTVVAKRQIAGRGRLDRSFFSPEGGLYFSTVLRTALTLSQYGAITPFAGVAVCRAIKRLCGVTPTVKWVNDLLLDGKKICGILAESGTDKYGQPYVILGIGINTGECEFPPELSHIAGHLPCACKEELLREILKELSNVEQGVLSASWVEEYRENSAVIGKEITVSENKNTYTATATDILPSGALCVRLSDGTEKTLYGQEITLRLSPNAKK